MKTIRQRLTECDLAKVYKHIWKKDQRNAAKCDRPVMAQVKNNYGKVVMELLGKPPTKPYKMPIVVKTSYDLYNKEHFFEVLFLNPNYVKPPKGAKPWGGLKKDKVPKGHYNANLDKYNEFFGFGFTPWSKIIDTPIVNKTKLTWEEALGEFLWELTFYGWTEERVKEHTDEIMGRIEEAKEEIKEGKCIELPPKKKDGLKVVIPDSVSKQIIDIANKKAKKCGTCLGYGLWALGDSTPMGPMDASDGMPTKPCPECGANPNK